MRSIINLVIFPCDNAVIRETYREESTWNGVRRSWADRWDDPAHAGRHGRPRLVRGDARAWVYTDFDGDGHEPLLVEQRLGASMPSGFLYVVSNELHDASGLSEAFMTVRDFTPPAGDSAHPDDAAKPRCETLRYMVTDGTETVWESYGYDAFGNRTSATDELGQAVETDCDVFGNVIAEWGATYPVEMDYDTESRRVALRTTRDGTTWDETRWTYDAATGACTSKTYADESTVAYAYTPDNLLLRTTYASGRWKENVYDARRRLCGVVYSSSDMDYELQLDAYDRTTYASNGVLQTAYALNAAGGVTNETRTAYDGMVTMTRTFDVANRLTGLAIPERGYEISIGYSTNGLLASVSSSDAIVTYAYSTDLKDLGYVITFADGGTSVRTVTHDPFRRDLILFVAGSCGTFSYGIDYLYDSLSRPIARNADDFTYNKRGEVYSASLDGLLELHEYDGIGNSTLAVYNFATNVYTANNLNQYTSIFQTSTPLRNPTYDLDGNMTFDGVFTYSYDAENRLVSIASNGMMFVTNQYDHKGRRVRKVTPNAETAFLYDDWNLIHEQEVIGNVTNETFYYWGKDISGSLQGSGGIGGLLYQKRNGVIHIPHYDVSGNVAHYTDTVGNVVASYKYDTFGNLLSASGPLAHMFRFLFSTRYLNVETGHYYYIGRFYIPNLMRWLNRDPIGDAGGKNLYAAFNNTPLTHFDPLGFKAYVMWHLPGDDLLYQWSSRDSTAETHFRASAYSIVPTSCGSGKNSYKVMQTPPTSLIDVYFRGSLTTMQYALAKKFEDEHVSLYVAYDKCIEEFKQKVESICDCRKEAERQKKEAEDWLERKARYYKGKNEFLDRKGGPHGH